MKKVIMAALVLAATSFLCFAGAEKEHVYIDSDAPEYWVQAHLDMETGQFKGDGEGIHGFDFGVMYMQFAHKEPEPEEEKSKLKLGSIVGGIAGVASGGLSLSSLAVNAASEAAAGAAKAAAGAAVNAIASAIPTPSAGMVISEEEISVEEIPENEPEAERPKKIVKHVSKNAAGTGFFVDAAYSRNYDWDLNPTEGTADFCSKALSISGGACFQLRSSFFLGLSGGIGPFCEAYFDFDGIEAKACATAGARAFVNVLWDCSMKDEVPGPILTIGFDLRWGYFFGMDGTIESQFLFGGRINAGFCMRF